MNSTLINSTTSGRTPKKGVEMRGASKKTPAKGSKKSPGNHKLEKLRLHDFNIKQSQDKTINDFSV